MDTIQRTHLQSLSHRGFVRGVTISSKATDTPLCHFYGGLRYGLAPSKRWRRAHPLPESYTYGTKEEPGLCDGGAGVCPQPGFIGPPDESSWTEDCFQCNVWVPIGEPPKDDGGWLQAGTPNSFSVAALLGETAFKCVIVMPAYRLGVFGFLYSSEVQQDAASASETVGNHGFWDQRLALEWTKNNVKLFGGNAENITISGYSAGAYSVFYQLAYDMQLPEDKAVIKRACMWSNGPGVQPKAPSLAQEQFNQLLAAVNIPHSLSPNEKISRLRSIPSKDLLQAATSIDIHQFRPTTDSNFISPTLFKTLDNGEFAKRLSTRNIRIMLGECRDEHNLYSIWFPPTQDTLPALHKRLLADYPPHAVNTLTSLYYPTSELPPDCKNWDVDAFGRIYADMQVHKTQRGLVHSLAAHGASHLLYRYRFEFRAKCVDRVLPPEWGVTHTSDCAAWFWGNGGLLRDGEKEVLRKAFIDPLVRFVNGHADIGWGGGSHREMRTLKPDGRVVIWNDEYWDAGLRVWRALREVGELDDDSQRGSRL